MLSPHYIKRNPNLLSAFISFFPPLRLQIPLLDNPHPEAIKKSLLVHVPAAKQDFLATFLEGILKLYRALNFAYMEVNPLVSQVFTSLHFLLPRSFSAPRLTPSLPPSLLYIGGCR